MIAQGSKVVAKLPFNAEGEGELTMRIGDLFTVLSPETEHNPGWVLVQNEATAVSGYVPSEYIALCNDSQQPRISIAVPPNMARQFQEETLQNEYAETAWERRDQIYGQQQQTGTQYSFRVPHAVERRWYYRDLFNDMQGPFNEEEMAQRVGAKHIQADTYCVCEVGFTPSRFEERRLKELFPSEQQAFRVPARLTANPTTGMRFWYFFQDSAKPKQGPFDTEQMRFWFDGEGYFGSTSLVCEASNADLQQLKQVFPDPMMCFYNAVARQQQQQPQLVHSLSNNSNPFPSTSPIQHRRSSRALLHQALSGESALDTTNRNNDDLDETLALFDKIELETTTKEEGGGGTPPMATSAIRVYGDSNYLWPLWRGVPQTNTGPNSPFPTALYSFVTRPLNPKAGKILSHITREIQGVMSMNYDKFRMFLENENGKQLVLVASRHTSLSGATTFDIKLVGSERMAPLLIAKLDVNFLGTQFTLHNDVPGHVGTPKDLCCILYEANRMGSGGPRKMKVAIPDLDDQGEFKVFKRTGGTNQLVASLNALNTNHRCIAMLNKPPKWNAERNAYALDFGGRVKRASVKNFQLVDALNDPEHQHVILQHGRVSDDKFTADVMHPMSLLQAFAVCLSSLHQKKAVD